MDDEHMMATISYALGLVTGIAMYVREKNAYVRFHAIQSSILCLIVFMIWFFVGIVALILSVIPLSGLLVGILFLLFTLGIGGIWFLITVLLMYKSYIGEKYKLPVIGNIAERYSAVSE